MKKVYRCLWSIPLVLGLALPVSSAGQSKQAPAAELTKRAELVAVGRVAAMKAEWNETRSSIRTRVTLSVDEYVKGSAGKSLDVFVPGGEVDGVGELYTHTPRFSRDEDVVVFLEKDKKNRYRVSGGDQGKYAVRMDKKSGKRIVSEYWPLEDFKGQIKRSMRAQGQQ